MGINAFSMEILCLSPTNAAMIMMVMCVFQNVHPLRYYSTVNSRFAV